MVLTRPSAGYTPSYAITNTTKYQDDSAAVPKVAISSAKIDGDINKAYDLINDHEDRIVTLESGGTSSFTDNSFEIKDNLDDTKKVAFQVSGVTTGTTRTLTVPDANGTVALTGHSHTASDITDFSEAVDDRVGALIVAGTGISATYNDGANTLTIANTSSGGMLVARGYDSYTSAASITSTIPRDDTIPQSSEGTQILSVTVNVPTTTARVRIKASMASQITGGSFPGAMAVFNGGSSAIAATYAFNNTADPGHSVLQYEYVPGSSGNVTITVRAGPSSGTMYINTVSASRVFGGVMSATLVVDVIEP